MYEISYNIIFVYFFLIIDLIINITDHLLTASTAVLTTTNDVQVESQHLRDISSVAFIVVIIQIFAIICVVIDLVLHFFQVSDQVQQFSWFQICQRTCVGDEHGSRDNKSNGAIETPMPQRIALKLVLEKYWWSLLVGLLYLVLTIILQIIRLDPSWQHHRGSLNNGKLIALMNSDISGIGDLQVSHQNLRMDSSEFILNSEVSSSEDESITKDSRIHDGESVKDKTLFSLNKNFLPVIVLLIHKLMSTCYYVSFVVVYRATLNQKVTRIFVNKPNVQLIPSYNQHINQTASLVPDYRSRMQQIEQIN